MNKMIIAATLALGFGLFSFVESNQAQSTQPPGTLILGEDGVAHEIIPGGQMIRVGNQQPLPNQEGTVAITTRGGVFQVSTLAMIESGTSSWYFQEDFYFRDWNNVPYKAKIVGGEFWTMRHGTLTWNKTVATVNMKIYVNQGGRWVLKNARVGTVYGQFAYIVHGTSTWHITGRLQFLNWRGGRYDNQDRRTALVMEN